MKHNAFIASLVLSASFAHAAVLSSGPDAWTRGSSASTAYFGWDVIDAGDPGNPAFGGTILNDATPDIGTSLSTSVLFQQTTTGYGQRSATGNIYSGFTGDSLDLNVRFSSLNPTGSGSSTVFLTILGNPAADRELLPFSLSDGITSFAPIQFLSNESADVSGSRVWVAEWQLSGNAATEYTVSVRSDVAGGNGTDVAIDSITLDLATIPGATPLANSSTDSPALQSLGGVQTVPEPSSALFIAIGTIFFTTRRRR